MKKYFPLGLTISILFLATLLRLPLIGGSFWLDEAAQALESARPLSQQFNLSEDFQPPLLHLILHFALYFNSSEIWLRTIGALIPGLLAILFTLKIARLLSKQLSTKTRQLFVLFAGSWLATSSFHIFYSQELRPYSLPTFLATASWYFLLTKRQKSFFLSSVAGLYASFLYPFNLFGQLIYLWLTKPKRWQSSFWLIIGATTCFFPWLPVFFTQLQQSNFVRLQLPTWETAVSISQLKALPLLAGKWLFGVIDLGLNPWQLLIGLLIVGSIAYLLIKHRLNRQLLLFFCWAILPIVMAWLVSFFIPVFRPKRLLFALPAASLSLAWLVSWSYQQKERVTQFSAVFLASGLMVLNVLGLYQYWNNPNLQRENWRDLISALERAYNPNQTLVIFAFDQPFAPWLWYADDAWQTFALGKYSVAASPDWSTRLDARLTQPNTPILIFDYLQDLSDPNRQIQQHLVDRGYQQQALFTYPGIGFVREYVEESQI